MPRFIPHSEWLAGMPGTDPAGRPYSQWRPQSTAQPLNAPGADRVKGTAIHYPGSSPGTATHAAAAANPKAYVQSVHRGHRNRQPTGFDLGYGFVVVPNGDWYEGRAWYRQAAHGGDSDPGDENEQYLAIQLPVDTERPQPNPTAAQVATTRMLIAEQRRRYPGANEISDHRTVDGPGNTSCPGEVLHRMVVTGAFEPGSGQTEEIILTADDIKFMNALRDQIIAALGPGVWNHLLQHTTTGQSPLPAHSFLRAGFRASNDLWEGDAPSDAQRAEAFAEFTESVTPTITAAVTAALEDVTVNADLSADDIAKIAAASAAAVVAEIAS